jgi:metal-sulfur cluster biosynthetic enzyme
MTADTVLDALSGVMDPDLRRDIVSLGFVKNLVIDGGTVAFDIELTTPACPVKDLMKAQAEEAGGALPGVSRCERHHDRARAVGQRARRRAPPMPGAKNIIAVGAGKGGVGKTTVAVNLALALAKAGSRVGILDGDIYGPNVPIMLGLQAQLESDGKQIRPAEKYGLQVVSIGFMTKDEAPVIWRGPMLHSAIRQFFHDVAWRDLDYLIIDMPPRDRRRGAVAGADRSGGGRHRRDHAAAGVAGRQSTRGPDVREAQRAHARRDREHELLRMPVVPPRGQHLRPWRRRDHGGADGRAVPRPAAHLRAHPRGQ